MRSIQLNTRLYLVAFGAIFIVLTVYISCTDETPTLAAPTIAGSNTQDRIPSSINATTQNNHLTEAPPVTSLNPSSAESTSEAWFAQHGVPADNVLLDSYRQLELKDLTHIADSGNPHAIYVLGERLLETQGSRAAYDYLFDMTAKGYINIYPLFAEAKKAEWQNAESPEEKQQLALEVISIYKMGSARGLMVQSALAADAFLKQAEVTLTTDNVRTVDSLQQELLQKFLARQGELQVGTFEKVPTTVINAEQKRLNELSIEKLF